MSHSGRTSFYHDPFVEQSRPQTLDEVLRCPAAVNGMTAPTALVSDEQIATVASLIEQRLLGQMASADAAHHHGDRTSRYQQEDRDSLRRGTGGARSWIRAAGTQMASPGKKIVQPTLNVVIGANNNSEFDR